jgi:hypothetical protein
MRVKNDTLNFSPKFQNNGKGIPLKSILEPDYNRFDYAFRNYFSVDGTKDLTIVVNGESVTVSNNQVAVAQINCKELVDYFHLIKSQYV